MWLSSIFLPEGTAVCQQHIKAMHSKPNSQLCIQPYALPIIDCLHFGKHITYDVAIVIFRHVQ